MAVAAHDQTGLRSSIEQGTMPGCEGKTVFIIGGASSQGASHARAYLAEEANVVVTDIRDVGGRSRVADLGERVHDLHLGVAREEDWADAVVAIER